jgi:hypothetical protein
LTAAIIDSSFFELEFRSRGMTMNLHHLIRGLLGLYAWWLALGAVPWLLDCGAATLQAIREHSAAPLPGIMEQGRPVMGGLLVALALAVLGGRLARLLVRGLPDSGNWDGQPVLRAAQAAVGAVLVLAAVPAAAEAGWMGFRPAPYAYALPPQAGTDLAAAALWLTAGLVLFMGGRALLRRLARFRDQLTAHRPRR